MSTTRARVTIDEFTADRIDVTEAAQHTLFLNATDSCSIMVGHPYSTSEEIVEEIRALRKLAATALDVARQLEERQLRRDGEALGRRIAADEGIEAKADPVPWPTGLCGHPVPPGAWAAGYTRCRDCVATDAPGDLPAFDAAAGGEPSGWCGNVSPEDKEGRTWTCGRPAGHTGRHEDRGSFPLPTWGGGSPVHFDKAGQ